MERRCGALRIGEGEGKKASESLAVERVVAEQPDLRAIGRFGDAVTVEPHRKLAGARQTPDRVARISEEWRAVHANRRARGIAHVAHRPFGYQLHDKDSGDGASIKRIDEDEAAGVRLMFELRNHGCGFGLIRRRLHEGGFKTTRGAEFFATSTIDRMLANPIYAGLLRLPDGELVEAAHEAIVSRETWERAQRARTRAGVFARRHSGLLSGLVVCAGCGRAMKRAKKSGRPDVYRCTSWRSSSPCPGGSQIKADALDAWVVERLLLDRAAFEAGRERAAGEAAAKTRRQRARLAAIARRLDALSGLLGDEDEPLAADEYRRQMRPLVKEREAIQVELASLVDQPTTALPSRRKWDQLDLDGKRTLLRGLVEKVEVKRSTVCGGSHQRGIDFDQRVTISLRGAPSEAELAIARLFIDNVDLAAVEATDLERTPEGCKVPTTDAEFARAWERSPYAAPRDDGDVDVHDLLNRLTS